MQQNNIIYHDTFDILGLMLYKIPKLHILLQYLNIVSPEDGRFISTNNSIELSPLISDFVTEDILSDPNKIKTIVVVGHLFTIALIPMEKGEGNKRIHPIMYITGENIRIEQQSWSLINSELNDLINIKDFLPNPFCRKIIYISSWTQELKGVMFSEVGMNIWTINDPTDLPLKNTMKSGSKEIIRNILLDLREI